MSKYELKMILELITDKQLETLQIICGNRYFPQSQFKMIYRIIQSNPNLSTLKIDFETIDKKIEIPVFTQLGQTIGTLTNLKDLTFYANNHQRGSASIFISQLENITRLETLNFRISFNPNDVNDIEAIANFISQQQSLKILQLRFGWVNPKVFKLLNDPIRKSAALITLSFEAEELSGFKKGELTSILKNILWELNRLTCLMIKLRSYEFGDEELVDLLRSVKAKRIQTLVLEANLEKITKKGAEALSPLIRSMSYMNQLTISWRTLRYSNYEIVESHIRV